MMEENRKLREKIERLEKAQSSQSEDPKFSTPSGDHSKEAETIQQTDRPQRGSHLDPHHSKEAETPQEAHTSPKGSHVNPRSFKEAETPQDADRPPRGSHASTKSVQEGEIPQWSHSRQGSKTADDHEADRSPKKRVDEETTTVQVMLKLMGMQAVS